MQFPVLYHTLSFSVYLNLISVSYSVSFLKGSIYFSILLDASLWKYIRENKKDGHSFPSLSIRPPKK